MANRIPKLIQTYVPTTYIWVEELSSRLFIFSGPLYTI